ncbi:MAG: hypothetical protein KDJ47_10450 [Hyphomicrobiaceae bacterium]|nr:hypothetical protein [Hyphomicrobiaceae bacterium]
MAGGTGRYGLVRAASMQGLRRALLAVAIAVMPCVLATNAAHANWLTRLAREAGEAGGSAARHAGHGLDNLGGLTRHLKSLPHDPKSVALAAHATPEGHWKFSNREGEVFTAANADEMSRVVKTLAPEHSGDGPLKLYLTEDTVFQRPEMIKDLPGSPELHLLTRQRSYRLRVDPGRGNGTSFVAEVTPNLWLRMGDQRLFDEAVWHLQRPLSKSSIRAVSLEPGGAQTLPAVPRFDLESKAALIDKIDPWKLPAALSSIRGQTLVVTGRVEGEFLFFRPQGGGEKSLLVADLKRAAKDSDVNLVILEAADPLQPGGRNWFWQKVEVKGLDTALKQARFADFLDALGQRKQGMIAEVRESQDGRIAFDVKTAGARGAADAPITDTLVQWTESLFSQALGNVVSSGIKADLPDKERQQELDRRIIPGIPFLWQALYFGGLVLGLAGLSYVKSWWRWLWPAEDRAEYGGRFGYHAARAMRGAAFVLIFMPVAGIPAGLWALIKGTIDQLWFFITLPFRVLSWLWRRIAPAG